MPRRAQGPPPLPRGPVPRAGRHVREVPRARNAARSSRARSSGSSRPTRTKPISARRCLQPTHAGRQPTPAVRRRSRRRRSARIPYYLYIRLPGDERESFLMLQSFVPVSQNNQQLRLVSFLTAKSDRRQLRRDGVVRDAPGPDRRRSGAGRDCRSTRTPTSRRSSRCSNQQPSRIIRGNVQLIPVGNSIVYVQPIYIEGEGASRFPIYQFVAYSPRTRIRCWRRR